MRPPMQWIWSFDEGDGRDRALLGGKGAGLCEMTRLGLPVPPGFTLSTAACVQFLANGERWPEGLDTELASAVSKLEAKVGKRFGDRANPLLVSVRSGAA